ncbi:hypothetical protein [Actinocorallia longicatena]|uniref:Uncharacterized protein n=1 Tax=Actinocorallia longicatena TaxID=111803 RepID=A0ABP6QBF0_9ACTN
MTANEKGEPVSIRARPNVSTLTRTYDDHRVTRLDDVRPGALRAWASACWHLRACGLEPLPPRPVVNALRRRGWWPSA